MFDSQIDTGRIGSIVFSILLIFFLTFHPSILTAQDGILRGDGDISSSDPHPKNMRVKIKRIEEEFAKETADITAKIERVKERIVESDDREERERLMSLLTALDDQRLKITKTAAEKIADLRLMEAERRLVESVKTRARGEAGGETPSTSRLFNPPILLAGGGLLDVFGAKPEFGGYVRTRFTADLQKDNDYEDLFEAHPKAYVKLKYPIGDSLSFFISAYGQLDYYTGGSTRYDHEVELDEAYLDIFFTRFDIRVGNQVFGWGKTDSINPTDNLNSIYLNNAITGDIGEEIIPTFALKFDYYLDNTTFELVVVPFFQENRFDLAGSDWAIFRHGMFTNLVGGYFPYASLLDDESQKVLNRLTLSLFSPIQPTDSPENTQGGARISSTYKGWDFSLSYIYAFDKYPTVHISDELIEAMKDSTVPGYIAGLSLGEIEGIMELKYHRYHMAGFDFAKNIGKYGVRGEAALFFDRYTYTEDFEAIKRNYILYVLGIDRQFKGNFYVNLQLVQKIILDYRHEILEDEVLSAMTLYTYKKFFNEKLNVEARAIYNLNDGDFYVSPKVSYKYTDSLEFTIGMNILEGDDFTIFGYFDDNNQIFFEVKYYF